MGMGERIALFARRATQPYRVLGRTVIVLSGVLFLLFLLLTLLRLAIMPTNCPDAAVITAVGQVVHIQVACNSGSWLQSFGISIIDNLAAGLIVALVSIILLWLVSPKD